MKGLSIIQRLILRYYTQFKFRKTDAVSFPDFARNMEKALVILPRKAEDSTLSGVKDLVGRLSHLDFHIVGFEEIEDDFFSSRYTRIEKLRFSTVPVNIEQLMNRKFDISIDLNRTFFPASALTGLLSNIPRRVGFCNMDEGPYYNLLFDGDSIAKFSDFMEDLRN